MGAINTWGRAAGQTPLCLLVHVRALLNNSASRREHVSSRAFGTTRRSGFDTPEKTKRARAFTRARLDENSVSQEFLTGTPRTLPGPPGSTRPLRHPSPTRRTRRARARAAR